MTDKGFNPSPVWLLVGRWAAQAAPLTEPLPLKLLLGADLMLLLLATGLVAYTFGLETGLLSLIYLVTFWGTFQRLIGNVLQYTWLAALMIGSCLFELKRFRASGLCFAWAITERLFPAFLLAGLALRLAFVKTERRELALFFAWLSLGGLALLLATLLFYPAQTPGPGQAWLDFYTKMAFHSAHLRGEFMNIGLPNLVATLGGAWAGLFTHADQFKERRWFYGLLAAGLAFAFVRDSARRRGLSFTPLFACLTLSRYYYLGLGNCSGGISPKILNNI